MALSTADNQIVNMLNSIVEFNNNNRSYRYCKMNTYKFISYTALILWMSIIFFLSHQPAKDSSNLSIGITDAIVK
jgi:hypothetical protein